MTEIEITTAADRAPDDTEPRLTLSQLQGLLRDAAALERAQRPIVLAGPEARHYPAQVPSAEAYGLSVPDGYGVTAVARPGRQAVGLDLTNVVFLPTNVAPLAPVPESRSLAPLAFLVTGTAFVASVFGTAVTGGNPILIAAALALLTGTAVAFSRIVGNGVNR